MTNIYDYPFSGEDLKENFNLDFSEMEESEGLNYWECRDVLSYYADILNSPTEKDKLRLKYGVVIEDADYTTYSDKVHLIMYPSLQLYNKYIEEQEMLAKKKEAAIKKAKSVIHDF